MSKEQPEREALQETADATERDIEDSYLRWRSFMDLIAEVARRSDAMLRLERALDLQSVLR
jgi:hypothetical protein